MTEKKFQKIVRSRLKVVEDILLKKGQEYTRDDDRLIVFRREAQRKNKTVLDAIDDIGGKHYSAFMNIIEDVREGKPISQKEIDDRITDIIIYTLLSETAIIEHNENL